MLKKVIITNYLGETAEYKIEGVQSDDESGLFITSVDGLGPVKATINMMDLATTDGQLYNSARLSGRNIVIKALFTEATSIEEARLLSYKYFPIKSKVNIKIVTDKRTAETNGYVESNEPDIFSEREGCQISILCENPYFDGGQISYIFNDTIPELSFPFGNESLNENLIELSRNSYIEDEREFFYEGDADSGMEIEFSVPSDDIMDTFKVSGTIEIDGENDQKIKVDTSKMASQVPNTAPNGAFLDRMTFYLDENRYKLINRYRDPNINGIYYPLAVFHKGELHLLYDGNEDASLSTISIDHHMKWDFKNRVWIDLPEIPYLYSFVNDPLWVVNCKCNSFNGEETIFAYAMSVNRLYYYDEANNGWHNFNVFQPSSSFSFVAMKGIVHNDEIHAFGYNSKSSLKMVHCKLVESQGSAQWVQVEDLSTVFPSDYDATALKVIKVNDKIHVLGGGSNHNYDHYIWNGIEGNGSVWVKDSIDLPVSCSSFGGLACYKNKLYAFCRKADAGVYTSDVYIYDSNWTLSHSIPIYVGNSNSVVADSHYIYLISPSSGNISYYEEANNIKLIENDRLVINTNKGKKSVTLYRDGNKYNVLSALEKNPNWLQIHRGTNKIAFDATEGSEHMQVKLTTNKWYEGV